MALLAAMPVGLSAGRHAHAGSSLEERKMPMHFRWHEAATPPQGRAEGRPCTVGCRGWVAAVGVITGDTPAKFAEFAAGRDLTGATVVLDSSGGSVLDAIKLGREWRDLGMATTVGMVTEVRTGNEIRPAVYPEAYCESMCVFLLLSGKTRTVPAGAHGRVHQIWMGDRADDATAASYSAQDVTIIERDVGRLAKYTFDMGGSGELLGLALSVPPWEPLHELTPAELRQTNIVSSDAVADAAAEATPRAGKIGRASRRGRVEISVVAVSVKKAGNASAHATKTAEAQPLAERGDRPKP